MILNEKEQEVLRTIAKWYREGKNDIDRNSAIAELQITDSEYNTIMLLMEKYGAIEAKHGLPHEPNYVALDFTPLCQSEQIVRQIDEQIESKKRAAHPDFVQQLQSHVRQNPWTANKSVIMDYKKCKEFIKKLKKIGKITDPVKRGGALSILTQDMRQNGFDFPLLYRRSTTKIMQLIKEEMEKSNNRKLEYIRSFIKVSSIVLGVVASVITIIWFIIHFFF